MVDFTFTLVPVKSPPPAAYKHSSFLQASCPSCCKSTEGMKRTREHKILFWIFCLVPTAGIPDYTMSHRFLCSRSQQKHFDANSYGRQRSSSSSSSSSCGSVADVTDSHSANPGLVPAVTYWVASGSASDLKLLATDPLYARVRPRQERTVLQSITDSYLRL